MEMEDQYGMADFRPYTDGRANFPAIRATGDLFSGHRNLTQAQHYEMVMMGRPVSHEVPPGLHDHHHHHHQFHSDSTTTTTTTTSTNSLNGLENMEGGGIGGDGGTGRWPRQETLTLLEIRSRLDSKFKEANQKGPLWDEVSRIMYEEHGYQRSGKKCREKFENLYKYYKKTKDGKAGRQDGKHYRFFRQLEALYGETSNPSSVSETHLVGNSFRFHNASNTTTISNQEAFQAPKLSESLSLSSSSEFNSSSSDDNDANAAVLKDIDSTEKRKKRRGKRSWKAKISDFIDTQMRKLMEKQEEWLEKMMKSMERKEEERIVREEEWRKQEAGRIDREHKFWTNERAWIEARDAALMEALQKLTGKKELMETELQSLKDNQISNENGSETITNIVNGDHSWPEFEIAKLIQLRDVMESRFQQSGCIEEILWEEIAAKMAYLGYDRSALMCKDKWDSINNYLRKTKECNKKRKENSRSCCYFPNHELIYHQGGAYCEINEQEGPHTTRFATNDSASPPNSNTGNAMHDSCFRLLMGDGGNLWETYGVKHSKGENH